MVKHTLILQIYDLQSFDLKQESKHITYLDAYDLFDTINLFNYLFDI